MSTNMNKIYITTSFQGVENKEEIYELCNIIKSAGFEDFCFTRDIEHFKHVFDDHGELMARSLKEIEKCDYLFIDMTDKPTGRAYEAGMAYALGKRIIVVMKKGTQIKETTRGIADIVIEYDEIKDIILPLQKYRNNY